LSISENGELSQEILYLSPKVFPMLYIRKNEEQIRRKEGKMRSFQKAKGLFFALWIILKI